VNWNADEIRAAFVGQFAIGGNGLGSMRPSQQSEVIRVAIWREKLQDEPFHDSGLTYAAAYSAAFGRALELRSAARYSPPADPEPDDDLEDTDDGTDDTAPDTRS